MTMSSESFPIQTATLWFSKKIKLLPISNCHKCKCSSNVLQYTPANALLRLALKINLCFTGQKSPVLMHHESASPMSKKSYLRNGYCLTRTPFLESTATHLALQMLPSESFGLRSTSKLSLPDSLSSILTTQEM